MDEPAGPSARVRRTRERILEATLDQLALSGYHGLAVGDVARAAGMTRAGVLHHYPSKSDLVVAALDHRNLRNARATHVIAAGDPETLFSAILQMMELNAWVPDLVRAYTILSGESVAPGHPAHDWFQAHYRSARASIAAVLRDGAESGALRADVDAEAVAAQLVALMDGLQIQWLHAPDALDLRAAMRDAVDRVRRDLAAVRAV